MRGEFFQLEDKEFSQLYEACADHTEGVSHDDSTIATCWDADRLDLGRVGIHPDPARLCTEVARQASIIDWAHTRAVEDVVVSPIETIWSKGWQSLQDRTYDSKE